jgi:TatA/E family protein of Tat protein translocase
MIPVSALPAGPAFLSGGPGSLELLVLFMVVLVLFGPRRLPDVARTIGRVLHDLRRSAQDFRDQIMTIDADADEGVCDGKNPRDRVPADAVPPGNVTRTPAKGVKPEPPPGGSEKPAMDAPPP